MNRKKLLRLTAFIFFMAIISSGFSQPAETIITGKILGKDGLPLTGVSVQLKGKTSVSTATDTNGYSKFIHRSNKVRSYSV